MSEEETEAAQAQVYQFGKGNPDADEVAAVLTVIQAALAPAALAEENDDRPLAGGWKSYNRVLRRPHNPGREAWRYSARP
ncbi:hypothetical protein GCM10027030_03170 [Luteococcus sediminum]|uniref:acyl-CoA carboxylase subunit epsilon n=1 Tax=Luteococcus sp. TaxID=1969402 RepID=UPI00373526DC